MKYICLGYYEKAKHESMTEGEQQAMFDTCFEYDDRLRANGHFALHRQLLSKSLSNLRSAAHIMIVGHRVDVIAELTKMHLRSRSFCDE